MARKIFVSVLVVLATLVIVPSVLAALRSPSAFGSVTHGTVVSGGWASPLPMDAKRLRIGATVKQSLTIANDGSLPANYRLKARVAGDPRLAAQLSVVATRLADGATIFSVPVTHLQSVDLGRFAAGEHETLRLRMTLMSTGTDAGDNVLQGRDMSVGFPWTATQASP
ncbi:MAG: hypothetical protein H0W90_07930 [Actinobacteria bacterium]|nr:hypothetical protein [Actinomycetota bacterium]